MIIRFFRELFRPALKCARVGHRMGLVRRKVLRDATWPWVYERYIEERTECYRCGHSEEEWRDHKFICGISSLTMPGVMFELLHEQGFLVDSKWRVKGDEA